MNIKKIILIVAGLIYSCNLTYGQIYEEYIYFKGPKIINISKKLPDNLLSSKTLVVIDKKDARDMPERESWKKIGKKAHDGFKRAGVDAVAYYYKQDLSAGPDATNALVSTFTSRGIENLAILSYSEKLVEDSLITQYELLITPFNQEKSFLNHGQQAWHFKHNSLNKVMLELFRDAAKLPEKENLLIAETPEFYEDIYLIRGERFEKYPVDLKILKMGIRKFGKIDVPVNSIRGLDETVDSLNGIIEKKNETLKSVMEEVYPLKYEFYDPGTPEQDLRYKRGHHFLLLYVHTTGRIVKKILDYELTETETTYISVDFNKGNETLKTISADETVYKFYFRHILTGKIYLGSKWDADQTLEGALRNFLGNMKADLNLNQ